MNFLILWVSRNGDRRWAGPFETITQCRAAVPDDNAGTLLVVPLTAMTPAERRDAIAILG